MTRWLDRWQRLWHGRSTGSRRARDNGLPGRDRSPATTGGWDPGWRPAPGSPFPAHADRRRRRMDRIPAVHLHGHLDAFIFGIFAHYFPVRKELFLPLPGHDCLKILGERRYRPVRIHRGLAVSRASGKGYNALHAEQGGQVDGVLDILVVTLGQVFLRVDGVAMTAQAGDRHVPTEKEVHELSSFGLILQQPGWIAVFLADKSACPDLRVGDSLGLK